MSEREYAEFIQLFCDHLENLLDSRGITEHHETKRQIFQQKHKELHFENLKRELAPVAWHPSRHWDWCMPEDEKKEISKLWSCSSLAPKDKIKMKLFDIDYFTLNEICNEIGFGCVRLATSLGLSKHQVNSLQLAVYQGSTPAHMMMQVLRTAKPNLSVSEFARHLQACELFDVLKVVEQKISLPPPKNVK